MTWMHDREFSRKLFYFTLLAFIAGVFMGFYAFLYGHYQVSQTTVCMDSDTFYLFSDFILNGTGAINP